MTAIIKIRFQILRVYFQMYITDMQKMRLLVKVIMIFERRFEILYRIGYRDRK